MTTNYLVLAATATVWVVVVLAADFLSVRIIRFRVLGQRHWQIAFDEDHFRAKARGLACEVRMPAKPLLVRLWRMVFPLRVITVAADEVEK